MKISFVIPCYNSEKNIGFVLDEIRQAMEKRPEVDYEVIMVNDCSKDDTAAVIGEIARRDPHMVLVDLAGNVGQANAIVCGLNYVTGDYVMTSDDDGQTPVGRVFDFLAELEKGYDVVCARYVERDRPSGLRGLGSALNRAMSDWLIEKPEGTYMAAVFMARRFVTDEMIRYRLPYSYISGLILRITKNVGNLDVKQRKRQSGSSGYTFSRLLALWMNGFTAFSVKPLRLSAGTGFVLAFLSAAACLITLIANLLSPQIRILGALILEAVFFTCGLQLLFLGLAGEYIGRIYMCINKAPQYVVKEVVRHGEKG
ncbi:MAG: glycosyltransferase [Lachnospiraceae bacterium]|nr:glycosyltransferase [Lachnospiraceae bacterium]